MQIYDYYSTLPNKTSAFSQAIKNPIDHKKSIGNHIDLLYSTNYSATGASATSSALGASSVAATSATAFSATTFTGTFTSTSLWK